MPKIVKSLTLSPTKRPLLEDAIRKYSSQAGGERIIEMVSKNLVSACMFLLSHGGKVKSKIKSQRHN
ncbi:MAG TPA: hypothetical protein VK338_02455 [Candidatus Nitrosocosmicus sp.]|nr:hypothetical protein [Candidatus Nitrosocosmicus sp.]